MTPHRIVSLLPACYSVCYRLSRSGEVGTTRRQSPQVYQAHTESSGGFPRPGSQGGEWPHAPSPHPTRTRRWGSVVCYVHVPTSTRAHVSSKAGFAVTMVVSYHLHGREHAYNYKPGLNYQPNNLITKWKRGCVQDTGFFFFFLFFWWMDTMHVILYFYQIMLLNMLYADDRFLAACHVLNTIFGY